MGGNAAHDGIFVINFTAGRRRESSSAAFGKETAGNEFLGNAFFRERCPSHAAIKAGGQRNLRFWVHSSFAFATSETSVSGHATGSQAS
ncbi:TPA: hypothetical protein HA270_01035 [Candidatus Woesearchaeota archaeon]|nr:hypothetical protein [Candidatus Woesearchaeota archaeon]